MRFFLLVYKVQFYVEYREVKLFAASKKFEMSQM